MALTYVPPADLFKEQRERFNNDLDVIMNYFEDTHINKRPPLFLDPRVIC